MVEYTFDSYYLNSDNFLVSEHYYSNYTYIEIDFIVPSIYPSLEFNNYFPSLDFTSFSHNKEIVNESKVFSFMYYGYSTTSLVYSFQNDYYTTSYYDAVYDGFILRFYKLRNIFVHEYVGYWYHDEDFDSVYLCQYIDSTSLTNNPFLYDIFPDKYSKHLDKKDNLNTQEELTINNYLENCNLLFNQILKTLRS